MSEMTPEQPVHLADCDKQHGPEVRCNSNAYVVVHSGPEPEAEPTPEEPLPPPAHGLVRYTVTGRQAVDEVAPGGTVDLDPDEPRTERLLTRGQVVLGEPTKQED